MRERLWLAVTVVAFALSRVAYRLAGVRFSIQPIYSWQFADQGLLQHDLLRTLFYLHPDPPGYDAVVGLALKLLGVRFATGLHFLFVVAGLTIAVSIFALARRLGAHPGVAAVFAIALSVSPAAVLYENWGYPDYLVTALLVAAAVALFEFTRRGAWPIGLAFFAAVAAVTLTRSLFHVSWLLAVIALVTWAARGKRRRIATLALLPLALSLGLYVKNLALFGTLSASSCFGINASRVATEQVPYAERARLVAEQRLSPYATKNIYGLPFTDPGLFRRPLSGVPVLDQVLRPNSDVGPLPNFGNAAYVDICRAYTEDAFTVLRIDPGAYLRSERASWLIFFRPSSDYPFFSDTDRAVTHTIARVFDVAEFGQLRAGAPAVYATDYTWSQYPARLLETGWLIVAGYAVAAIHGWRLWRAGPRTAVGVTAAFALLTIAYIMTVGNLAEVGENNRFQFIADPLVVALVAAAVSRLRLPGRLRRGQGVASSTAW